MLDLVLPWNRPIIFWLDFSASLLETTKWNTACADIRQGSSFALLRSLCHRSRRRSLDRGRRRLRASEHITVQWRHALACAVRRLYVVYAVNIFMGRVQTETQQSHYGNRLRAHFTCCWHILSVSPSPVSLTRSCRLPRALCGDRPTACSYSLRLHHQHCIYRSMIASWWFARRDEVYWVVV